MPLLMKASILEGDEDDETRAYGEMRIRRLRELAGIGRMSVYRALGGLVEKDWIGLDEEKPKGWVYYWITTAYLD